MGRRQTWNVRKGNSRGDCEASANPEQAAVDRDVEGADGEARGKTSDDGDERPREENAEDGAGATEHETLGEQRPPERSAAGAERGAYGELALAADRAREDQVGDIRTRDDEDDRGGGEQHEQDRPCRRRNLIAQRADTQPHGGPRRVGVGMLAHHCFVRGRQLRARVLDRGAWREAAEQLRHPVCATGDHQRAEMVRARDDVGDDLRVGGIRHRRLEDTDDRRGARTEADGLADHGRIAGECRAPEAVRQNGGARRAWPVVCGIQQAPERRLQPHHVEERPVDDSCLDRARLAEADHRKVDSRELAERANRRDTRLEVINLGHRERRVRDGDSRCALTDVDQPILVAIDERPEQHAADDAEDRSVGADAERQRDDDGRRESPRAHERAQADPHLPQQRLGGIEPAAVPHSPHGVARVRDVAELAQRRQPRGLGIFAAIDAFLDADRQMAANLLVEVAIVRAHALLLARSWA